MASNINKAKKLKLAAAMKRSCAAPVWCIVRVFGRRGHRWRLNPHVRRHWRRRNIKV